MKYALLVTLITSGLFFDFVPRNLEKLSLQKWYNLNVHGSEGDLIGYFWH